jgi:hypothetical protein
MEYTHSKDYLIELASNPQTHGWLKDLIIKIVNNNGMISDTELADSVQQLKTNAASILVIPSTAMSNQNADIRLLSLTHHSGVCALANDQTIEFSSDITLLYGKNGSGKSSYFRILNEIVGGNHQTELRPNIYSKNYCPINIELAYTIGTNTENLSWDGSIRAINPLTLLSVFDSNYTKTFLQKRSADSAIVLPYGLHLFTALTTAMDSMKGRLQTEIDSVLKTVPTINTEGLSEDVCRIIAQQTYRTNQKKYIQDRYNFSEEQNTELQQQEHQLTVLKGTNYEDKIKLAIREKSEYDSLYQHLIKVQSNIQEYASKTKTIVKKILATRKAHEEVKLKIAILSEIGNTNSEEWKTFIEAGSSFINSENLEKGICPYCRQPIINDAVDIIAAYSTYLSDRSYSELNELIKAKQQLKQNISLLSIDYSISEQFKKLINSRVGGEELYAKVHDVLNAYTQLKTHLLETLECEQNSEASIPDTLVSLLASLLAICKEYNSSISNLREELAKKNQLVAELSERMKSLIEHNAISKQKELFVDWFDKIHSIEELKKCQTELSTRMISTLAKTASQTLVTDNLKSKFQEELDNIGLKKLSVELSDAGASRGQSFMQLRLINNSSVTDVLSEGEQKGVALALFIAERRMQLSNNPIILDDPVNSLDHFITAKLVERLSALDNQIIIFSHDLLLQTSLVNYRGVHECGKNQVSSCKKGTKHLFLYSVKSHGRDSKGVITEMKQDTVRNNLTSTKQLLDKIPFTETEILMIGAILRHTIELMIDEKIFNNQIPVKFHGRKNAIQWDQLKTLNPDAVVIDTLKRLFDRLSGGDLHLGVESTENPIDHDELENIYNELKGLN